MSDTQTATCTRSPRTVSRWYQPDPWDTFQSNPVDPGPWRDGETTECPSCHAVVTVVHRITNERSAGTQYVGNLYKH